MNYSRSGLILSLSNHFPKYSLFKDVEVTNNLAINFHKKVYADEILNQRMFKPVQIQITFDVVKMIEQRRGIEVHNAMKSLKNYISQCLQEEKVEKVNLFTQEKF